MCCVGRWGPSDLPGVHKILTKQSMPPGLASLSAAELKHLAVRCGANLGTRKSTTIEHLTKKVGDVEHIQQPARVVSLDLGFKNIGFCQLHLKNDTVSIQRWDKLAIDDQNAYPNFANAVIAFATEVCAAEPSVVLIEKQRARTMGSAALPHNILRLNVFEGMLFTAFRCVNPHITLTSVDPKAILAYWRLVMGLEKTSTYKQSKQLRLDLVNSWLKAPPFEFEFDPSVTLPSGKKDDMCDALVQAITWNHWRQNVLEMKTKFLSLQ